MSKILPELKSDEINPIVITLTHKGELASILEDADIPVFEPSRCIRLVQRIPVVSRLLGPIVTIYYLVRLFNKTPARLTCFYLPSSYYLGMIAAIITRETHNTILFRRSLNNYQKNRPFIKQIEGLLHKRTTAIVGNSQAVIDQLIREEGVPENKLTLIYNGINILNTSVLEDRQSLRNKLEIENEVLVFCIVANLNPYKGHQDLINGLSLISDKIDQPWLLLCAGKGIDLRPDLLELLRSKNLSAHVKWLGYRQDVTAILSASDIGFLVSHQEGFSNSLLECMAAGLPMIVTNVGGNREAIIDKKSGLLVEPHNPEQLSNAIMTLVENRELARQYGIEAKARVQNLFSMKACLDKYRKLFREL